MQIQIEPHTIQRIKERGATEEEVIDTLQHGNNILGKSGRFGKSKVFIFKSIYKGKYYEEKKLEVYYIIST